MTEQEVFTKIAALIEKHFNIATDKITNELNFQTDLDADSIDKVEFVLELEDEFGAEISDEDAEKLATVSDAVQYILAHQN
ncbi:acyl carrier protein [Ligilactobacillus saerimneri]|uniref:acyl carrier protein n=1 Tax=Ligilactobacillus saerimneri TaxID=228229 RepID=UPI001C10BD32|nr:acyl carrier protein [Ligilactobacillus saerimneri]MBU5308983.1 acyl carrier protein [Ligilactobacillus saerimneri]